MEIVSPACSGDRRCRGWSEGKVADENVRLSEYEGAVPSFFCSLFYRIAPAYTGDHYGSFESAKASQATLLHPPPPGLRSSASSLPHLRSVAFPSSWEFSFFRLFLSVMAVGALLTLCVCGLITYNWGWGGIRWGGGKSAGGGGGWGLLKGLSWVGWGGLGCWPLVDTGRTTEIPPSLPCLCSPALSIQDNVRRGSHPLCLGCLLLH